MIVGYRNIKIDSNIALHIKNQQLILGDDDVYAFPMEDISSILIENQTVKVSSYFLQKAAEYGIVVYICDEKHMPSTVLLPLARHSRHFRILKNQMNLGKPLQKRLWQQIVCQKVTNQAECLRLSGKEGSRELLNMVREVQSGDRTHVEAKAAAFYFRQLYGRTFTRADETIVNAALNYGYAIIRGMIARSLVCYGFEPSIGLFHRSELNSFNLADDIIEPFRPIVDLYVIRFVDSTEEVLTPAIKRELYNLVNYEMLINGERHSLSNCIDKVVASMSTSFQEQNQFMKLPTLIELQEHRYE